MQSEHAFCSEQIRREQFQISMITKILNVLFQFNLRLFVGILSIIFSVSTFANRTHVFSDPEGNMASIEALVDHGKLKWITDHNGIRQLDFVNETDSLVFIGDLMGPNWENGSAPRNIEIMDLLLNLKLRRKKRFDIVLGNHDSNRLKFIRLNAMADQKKDTGYLNWLKSNEKIDSVHNRVFYWAKDCYGLDKDGVPGPIRWYQLEMQNRSIAQVTVEQAAEQLAADMRVSQNGKADGRIVQFIKLGTETVIRNGYIFVHSPINTDAMGIIPGNKSLKKETDIRRWLDMRRKFFYEPEVKKFFSDIVNGRIPSDLLPSLADARGDEVSNSSIADSESMQYADRPLAGDQLRGIHSAVARAIISAKLLGLFSGHKPSGRWPGIHRIYVDGKFVIDVDTDVSRGGRVGKVSISILPSKEIEITYVDDQGKKHVSKTPVHRPDFIGMVTEEGYLIKVRMGDRYIAERNVGRELEQLEIPVNDIANLKLSHSTIDRANDFALLRKNSRLRKAIEAYGGTILKEESHIDQVIKGRFLIDMRGASDWATLPQEAIDGLKAELLQFRKSLDPSRVVLITGGNRAKNPNAFETLVHEIFGDVFDIVGFMKHDAPANEADPKVKYIYFIGEGENWDGPVRAALKFVQERLGISLMIGGGGVLRRSAESSVAALMKDRLYMFQGYGGASEEKLQVSGGIPVGTFKDLWVDLKKKYPSTFKANRTSRVGIYTDRFDPIHQGHRNLIKKMIENFDLDIVYIVPDKSASQNSGLYSFEDQISMVKEEFNGNQRIHVLTQEMQSTLGKGEMWDAMRVVMAAHEGATFFNLMDSDTFLRYQTLPIELRPPNINILINNSKPGQKTPHNLDGARVKQVDLGDVALDSSAIHDSITRGKSVIGLSKAVKNYIFKNGLYGWRQLEKNENQSDRFKEKSSEISLCIGVFK